MDGTKKYNHISEIPVTRLSADTLCDSSIIQLTTENGTKYIHFMGYGYYAGEPEEKPYRMVDYCGFEVPINEILPDTTLWEYEDEESCNYKQYIEDCTAQEVFKAYCEYDDGKAPTLINSDDVNENTPDGCYIMPLIFNIDSLQNESFSE